MNRCTFHFFQEHVHKLLQNYIKSIKLYKLNLTSDFE